MGSSLWRATHSRWRSDFHGFEQEIDRDLASRDINAAHVFDETIGIEAHAMGWGLFERHGRILQEPARRGRIVHHPLDTRRRQLDQAFKKRAFARVVPECMPQGLELLVAFPPIAEIE